ncbi:hypothetical protein [Spirosoma utsteinense]|uniref:Uncharacterized protein n=1 Tax=Spirosoma utsteinense TaxID=2585773 RepID=A0ABR6VZI1_9BACT|nr:hypothetical protein [Spirosoma utsteinense]MBC3784551.1 hypothetical protein [Spirosoma utsteinense]MBC3789698.1 hypothetical protein [Spirosoma utsteinense]
MENQDQDKEDILRAKQAISPAGLGDRSDKATRLPGNDSPEDTPLSGLDTSPSDDEVEDEATTHPNRNQDGKVDIDKPSYS